MTSLVHRFADSQLNPHHLCGQGNEAAGHLAERGILLSMLTPLSIRELEEVVGGCVGICDDDLHDDSELAFDVATLFRSPKKETSTDVQPA